MKRRNFKDASEYSVSKLSNWFRKKNNVIFPRKLRENKISRILGQTEVGTVGVSKMLQLCGR